jgi:lipopolysaccharide assembly outer membrane protein LptD (OstA)
MRPSMLILCFMFLACTLLARTNPNASQRKLVSAGYTAKSDGIVETGILALKGREIGTAASLTKCHGDCEITIHDVILSADELDFHPSTGEVEARGNVRVKVLPQGAGAAHQ